MYDLDSDPYCFLIRIRFFAKVVSSFFLEDLIRINSTRIRNRGSKHELAVFHIKLHSERVGQGAEILFSNMYSWVICLITLFLSIGN